VKLPKEISSSADSLVSWKHVHKLGHVEIEKSDVSVLSKGTFSYGFFDHRESSFLFSCSIVPHEAFDHFGLLFKSDSDAAVSLILQFDVGMNRVSLLNLPMAVDPFWQQSCQSIPSPTDPGPDGVRVAEKTFMFENGKPIEIKAIIDYDMVEVFIKDEVAFTYRMYVKPEYEIGYMVQDGDVDFKDISIYK
jgi:beta-fructofuranosidase